MPISNLHKDKKSKNYAVLAMLAVWTLAIFVITIVKIKGGN